VRAITFQASHILKSICEGGVTLLPTILALWNTRVHISLSDSHDITANIEALVDEFLGGQAIL